MCACSAEERLFPSTPDAPAARARPLTLDHSAQSPIARPSPCHAPVYSQAVTFRHPSRRPAGGTYTRHPGPDLSIDDLDDTDRTNMACLAPLQLAPHHDGLVPAARRRPYSPLSDTVDVFLRPRAAAWLSARAAEHTLGSTPKALRMLLTWSAAGDDGDLAWVLRRPRSASTRFLPPASSGSPVRIALRLPRALAIWVRRAVTLFGLSDASTLAEFVVRAAAELGAAPDALGCQEEPADTARLYADLGILGFDKPPASPERLIAKPGPTPVSMPVTPASPATSTPIAELLTRFSKIILSSFQ